MEATGEHSWGSPLKGVGGLLLCWCFLTDFHHRLFTFLPLLSWDVDMMLEGVWSPEDHKWQAKAKDA